VNVTRPGRLAAHALIAVLTCALHACTALPGPDEPHEYLDQSTAATIRVVGQPLVFAHERPEFAVHMRDYVTLAAAAVNRGGKTDCVLIAYFWSTFDEHGRAAATPARLQASGADLKSDGESLILAADDRRIELSPAGHSAREAGIADPVHAPPVRSITPTVYRTDLATLRFIASARQIAVFTGANESETHYQIWDDQREALSRFVRSVGGEP
jgi:hypothetical protein